jgi:hypothetical protein
MYKQDFRFCCLVGVNSVKSQIRGEGGGASFVGKWNKSLELRFPKQPGQLAEDFANETSVRRFTERYGPLQNVLSDFTARLSADDSPIEQRSRIAAILPPFEFLESEWRSSQELFCLIWETMAGRQPKGTRQTFPSVVGSEDLVIGADGFRLPVKGQFETLSGRLVFRANALWGLLLLDLCSVNRKRLRKCACPTCHSPYFVATTLKARFCELEECKNWGRNQTKLKWWNANRRDSDKSANAKKQKGGKDGTQKAR